MKPDAPILEVRGVTKRFPGGVVALDKVDIEIRAGEIHAILGENGAGKTTLMNILFGVLQPDEGEIYIHGKKVRFRSPLDAMNMGIGMVHQLRKLIPAHTVLENIILGHPKTGKILNLKKAREEVESLCKRYGFNLDLDARVWQLSAGEQQVVEIVRALYRGARILILDEPTSVLTPLEIEALLKSMKAMAKEEIATIPFVTHKLPEVFAVSDRVTILRRGKVVKKIETREATIKALAEYMVGREVLFKLDKPQVKIGDEILRVENLSAMSDKGVLALKGVSFSIREGEIFGIAGISGNGQQELAEVIAGLRKPVSGKVIFQGRDITHLSVLERMKIGIGYIPPERLGVGAIGAFSLADNILMSIYFDPEFSTKGFLNYKKIRDYAKKIVSEFEIVAPSIDTKAAHLSGGNLQRLILGRIIPRTSKLLIANSPTVGLDVAATEAVRSRLLACKKEGMGILFISEDLDEVLEVSDKIAPIYEGRFVKILPAEEARKEEVGAMMAGAIPGGS
ncbi:MAG: ABC transporter ATP-binding protein [Aigarchaeota archaeon]|nr:ABC transporter ATP-binding protein [Aigarchaeota archaeon]MCX8192871.1 ABC transporter ATP-binding protein [Nitrososphaeria archaeon]MDW7986599.1 ABC transporter ATP-binding protein [Nitrososphaerota archaeon]